MHCRFPAGPHVKCVGVRGGFSFLIGSAVSLIRKRACLRACVQAGRIVPFRWLVSSSAALSQ